MSKATLKSLFGYKAWANSELFALLATLPADHAEPLHACIRTLNHIYVVDRIFRAHLSGEPRPFDATNTKATPSLGKLRSEVEATDAWYQDYVASLAAQALREVLDFAFTDGDRGRMSREEILLHVVTHGGYHRGNVGQVLKSISVAPPRDLYTKFLHQSEPARREGPARNPSGPASRGRPAPATIDEYISGFSPEVQVALRKIRQTIRSAAPGAEEAISYRIPAFKQHGVLVYFAAFKSHIGLYPPVKGDARLERTLAPYAGEKGNLRFPLNRPIPFDLIERVTRLRLKQNLAKATPKSKRKST